MCNKIQILHKNIISSQNLTKVKEKGNFLKNPAFGYTQQADFYNGIVWIKTQLCCADFFSFKAEKSVNNRQYVHRVQNFLEHLTESIRPFFEEKLFHIEQNRRNFALGKKRFFHRFKLFIGFKRETRVKLLVKSFR